MMWRAVERIPFAQSQIALSLIDEHTGGPPIGAVRVQLEARRGARWQETEIRPAVTSRWVVTYPGLELRTDATAPPQRYRVLVDTQHYEPLYADPLSPGVVVDVAPYNEQAPPTVPVAPQDLFLLPAATYPFPSHVRVLRGQVRLASTHEPVARAMVREGPRERVLTDARGVFALPLRWPATNAANLAIDVDHPTSGNTTITYVTLPAALAQGMTIDIS